MNLNLNRAQRSKLHVAMLEALNALTTEPISAEDAAKQAFCEAVCWADTGDIANLDPLFTLANAIDHHVYQAVYNSDCQYADVNAEALRKVHGIPTVNLALKLAGYFPRQRGRKMVWTDAENEGCKETVPVVLAADILEKWSEE